MTTARRPGHPLRRAAGTLAAIALIFAAGCTTETPEQPPTDPPPASASPTESKRDQEAQKRIDAATAALMAMSAEEQRLWANGGAEKATPKLKEHATGDALKVIMDGISLAKEEGLRTTAEPTVLLTESQGVGSPERVDLVECIDRSTTKVVDKDGKPFDDGFEQTKLMQSYQVHLVGEQWKVATIDSTLLDDWDRSPCDGGWEKDA